MIYPLVSAWVVGAVLMWLKLRQVTRSVAVLLIGAIFWPLVLSYWSHLDLQLWQKKRQYPNVPESWLVDLVADEEKSRVDSLFKS